jgi:trimethylamine:corrinoid methyltransferase-like protein
MRSPEIFKIQESIGFYDSWNKLSSLTSSEIVENAIELAKDKIKKHTVEPVNRDARKELEAIFKKACDQFC